MEQHPLTEQIEADRYLASQEAVKKPKRGAAILEAGSSRKAPECSTGYAPSWAALRTDRAPRQRALVRVVRARYDAAQTTADNRPALGGGPTVCPPTRPPARKSARSCGTGARYEVANNSYAKGIVLTLANDVVGTGPRLQMLLDDPAANQLVEQEFSPAGPERSDCRRSSGRCAWRARPMGKALGS